MHKAIYNYNYVRNAIFSIVMPCLKILSGLIEISEAESFHIVFPAIHTLMEYTVYLLMETISCGIESTLIYIDCYTFIILNDCSSIVPNKISSN